MPRTLLHIDSSARSGRSGEHAHGSHTRRLTHRFVQQWLTRNPGDTVVYRDIGQNPPPAVSGDWIHAAFTPEGQRLPWMADVLRTSDALVDELLAADVIVAGVPMYNFGPPAQFKAYIDNLVRLGRTFGFDRSRGAIPYWPMLSESGKQLVIFSSRGDFGYGKGEHLESHNHVERSVRTAFAYMGVTDVHEAAIDYDEFADVRLAESIVKAEAEVDALVEKLG